MRLHKKSEKQYFQLKSQKTDEEYSLSSVISDVLQAKDIFLSHEIVRPNSRSSAPHFHTESDEIVYVVKGNLTAKEGDTEIKLNEGDSIIFEGNSGLHHFLKNESNHESQVLVIRKKIEKSDIEFE